MGYRGEGHAGSGYDGRDDSYQDSYGQGDDEHETGDYSAGAYSTGSYVEGGYGTGPSGYGGGYGDSPDSRDSGAYHSAPYDDAYSGSSYNSPSRDTGPYNSGSFRATPSDDSGSYSRPSYVSGGYPTLGHPSGGYPAQGNYPNDTAGIPDPFADGNDWYGEQSGARQTGFSDTSTQIALRDPVRGYPPATGPQRQYNEGEYPTYPGYEGVEQDSPGYGARQGYDDYDDYSETRLDQPAVRADYDDLDDYGPAWGSTGPTRRFGQALQGDDFDGGVYHDGAADAADMLSGPGPKKPKKGPKQQRSTGPGGGAPRRRRRGRALVLTVTGLVIIAAAGFGGYKYLVKHKATDSAAMGTNESLPSTAPSSAMAQCVAQYGEFCHIETRLLDPAPLTLGELYPPAFFNTSDSSNFTRVATKEDTTCANAVYGTDLQAQLKTGACTQILRASYISGDSKIMGTIGVINLSSTNQAHYAGKMIGGSSFILPLPTSTGPTSKLGKAKGWIQAQYRGHYLIVTWAQFANGTSPSTQALVNQLQTFESDLIQGTANSILSQRMVYGDTASTAPSATASPSASASASASSSAKPTSTS